MKASNFIALFLCLLFVFPALAEKAADEDGYSLWLRYNHIEEGFREKYYPYFKTVTLSGNSSTFDAIKEELSDAFHGFFSSQINISPVSVENNSLEILLVKQNNSYYNKLKDLNYGAYILISDKKRHKITLMSLSEDGLLYGTFHLLRLLQNRSPIDNLYICESPKLNFRMLNQWDNLAGSIERGYSGNSIYKWDELPDVLDERYKNFARANASIGINAICIHNVNADPNILRTEYLEKVSKLAEIFRPYKIKLFLSANFSAPMEPSDTPHTFKRWGGIGDLKTNDPLNNNVITWWKNKIDEIYRFIPDFGGFVVKANSEGMPGPQDYSRTHADGANMFATLLEPYDGIVVWRAFVYVHDNERDRAKQSYHEFYPLDGKFKDNVFLQVKNGPMDFQPSEPPHPLFGAMNKTSLMPELQITQEYLGHSTYLVYLGPMWEAFLDFETFSPDRENNKISVLIQESYQCKNMTGMAGVSNVGNNRNWTGHHFAQANWYLFGRLAWNPQTKIDTITREWIRMTWSKDKDVIDKIQKIMDNSWKAFVDLQTPYGLPLTVDARTHYSPALSFRNNQYWIANESGIGYDRSTSGSNYVGQYYPQNRDIFNNIETCPEEYLLFFHFIDWNDEFSDGKSFYDAIIDKNNQSVQKMKKMQMQWMELQDKIDARRHAEVFFRLEKQINDAILFRESYTSFFKAITN